MLSSVSDISYFLLYGVSINILLHDVFSIGYADAMKYDNNNVVDQVRSPNYILHRSYPNTPYIMEFLLHGYRPDRLFGLRLPQHKWKFEFHLPET